MAIGGHGRHAAGRAAIPVSAFLSAPVSATAPIRRAEAAGRGPSPAVLALTTAGAMALTSLALPTVIHPPTSISRVVAAPDVQLTGVISPAEVTALVDSLHEVLASTSSTVSTLVSVPGQTVAGALNAAATVNDVFFGLLSLASSSSPVLKAVLEGLRMVSANGLWRLASTVSSVNSAMVLSTKQLSTLLTTTLTGSLGTVVGAVADLLNNPFALSTYVKLADVPVDAAGLALHSGISALADLGTNALAAGNAVVQGIAAQVNTAISAINAVFVIGHNMTASAALDGLLTSVHGIVTAPLSALVNSVDGISTAVTNGADDVLGALADTAAADVRLWLGDGTSAGAVQQAINAVGAAPLSIASYATAVSTLVAAAISTVTKTVGISAQKLAQIPFTMAGDLAKAGAGAVNAFINGTAGVVAGLLQAAGVPSLLYNISYGVAAFAVAVNNHLASGIAYTLDGVATTVARALGAPAASTGKTSGVAAVSTAASVTAATTPAAKVATAHTERVRKPVAAADPGDSTSATGSPDSSAAQSDGSGTAHTPRKHGRHSADGNPSASSSTAASSSTSATGRHGSAQQGRHHRS